MMIKGGGVWSYKTISIHHEFGPHSMLVHDFKRLYISPLDLKSATVLVDIYIVSSFSLLRAI